MSTQVSVFIAQNSLTVIYVRYEENGAKLYHAVALVQGVRVPGMTGTHL